MMFLYIYIGFGILTFVMLLTQTYVISRQLKREYPDIMKEYNEKNKTNFLEKAFVYLRLLVCCFIPIVNMGIFYVSTFDLENTKEKGLNKIKDAIKEGF